MSAQPLEIIRFCMFVAISLLIMFIGQGIGLMIGAVFNVVVSIDNYLKLLLIFINDVDS